MIGWLIQRIAAALNKRFSPAQIDAAFDGLSTVIPMSVPEIKQDTVRVAALQVAARYYPDTQAFIEDIDRYMAAAVGQGAQLVAFPELFGLLPLTMVPLVRTALNMASRTGGGTDGEEEQDKKKKQKDPAPLLTQALSQLHFLTDRYIEVFSRFAKRYGIWLSAGTLYTEEGGRVYNRHLFFGPDGTLLAQQDKLHPVAEEIGLGMATGSRLSVIPTPVGNVALSICMDATYFETFRAAKALGADYVLVPIANMEPYDYWLALRGAQSRVSETGLCAVKAALVNDVATGAGVPEKYRFPVELTGRAGIYFPLDFGTDSVEYAPQSVDPVVTADMDLKKIREFHSDCFGLNNKAFNNRYVDELIVAAQQKHRIGRNKTT